MIMKKLYFTALLLGVVASGLVAYQVAKADIYGSSLVAWYTLDSNDISGTSVTDNSGSGNTGTTVNSPTLVTGKLAQALSFNGTSQYVSTPSMNVGNVFTVSVWAETNQANSALTPYIVVANRAAGAGNGFSIELNTYQTTDKKIYFDTSNGSTVTSLSSSAGTWTDNVWHLITVVANRTTGVGSIYLDGSSVASGTIRTDFNTTAALAIGSYIPPDATRFHFPGSIDDVRIYNRALSAAEVAALYYQGNGFSNSF